MEQELICYVIRDLEGKCTLRTMQGEKKPKIGDIMFGGQVIVVYSSIISMLLDAYMSPELNQIIEETINSIYKEKAVLLS